MTDTMTDERALKLLADVREVVDRQQSLWVDGWLRVEALDHIAARLADKPACEYIVHNRDGSNYCRLAERGAGVPEVTDNYRSALEEIANPIAAMQKRLEPGCRLNGGMAVSLSESAEYLKGIAKRVLASAPTSEAT